MRTIKFRAWDKQREKMRPVASVGLQGGVSWVKGEHYGYDGNGDNFELMQFTGLLDKNGVEIYEGDIFGQLPQLRCVVERMQDGAYKLVFLDKRISSWSIIDERISKSNIIGNIHEHGELLNVPKE